MNARERYLLLRESAGDDVANAVFSHVSLANRQLWLAAH